MAPALAQLKPPFGALLTPSDRSEKLSYPMKVTDSGTVFAGTLFGNPRQLEFMAHASCMYCMLCIRTLFSENGQRKNM